MDFTTDKLRSLVRKWQSLIEANVDVKTVDGYVLRCFCIGFTKKRPFQIRKTSYAQSAQIRAIRKVKILKAPKFDAAKLAEIHSGPTGDDVGAKIAREAAAEAKAEEATEK